MIKSVRLISRRAMVCGLAFLVAAPVFAQATDESWQRGMAEGGLVVLVRHGATTWNGIDNIEWPRERQRLLSEAGEEQSRNLGEAFKRNGWVAGNVLASPFARTSEMAQIAFGRVTIDPMLLGVLSDGEGAEDRREHIRNLVSQTVPTGQNRVIVTHSSNISAATGQSVPEGGALVLRPTAAGHEVLVSLTPDDWARLATQ